MSILEFKIRALIKDLTIGYYSYKVARKNTHIAVLKEKVRLLERIVK